ncbi:winged helix-turn-helix domain-containing protein [Deinococcus sp. SDU3-2]|uniref:Winged helix-turn-helix domain-containing protein n=1 Tax=Deinococcus terrestris TaxID=2651870 RepID=A0A7X1TSM3_9DEIO|nr:winged helix-turn-helix domain-containing protein [Deinococcus terrestris]
MHGFGSSDCTISRIHQVIGVKHSVGLYRAHFSRKLRRWDFSYQRPALRAVKRNEEDIATWIEGPPWSAQSNCTSSVPQPA